MLGNKARVLALVGAQTGSEGKGVVAHALAREFQFAVRTGAPNAGHSIVHNGQLFKMQTIPCAWVNPDCMLIIGAGGLINLEILKREIEMIGAVDPTITQRLIIDSNCGILEQRHHDEEGGVNGEMHKRMGSTGEGVGPARRDRISRDPSKFRLAKDCPELGELGVAVTDTVVILHSAIKSKKAVMLEGTQGSGLSLIHGEWPHVTSSDTNAAQLAADAGIPPQKVTEVCLVARTYPIRVSGNSGPMKGELSWEQMSERVGKPVLERTTVTKKPRRIGEWNEEMFHKAVMLNDPDYIALTFMDYLDPSCADIEEENKLGEKALQFVDYIERTFQTDVRFVGTGFSETGGWKKVEMK